MQVSLTQQMMFGTRLFHHSIMLLKHVFLLKGLLLLSLQYQRIKYYASHIRQAIKRKETC